MDDKLYNCVICPVCSVGHPTNKPCPNGCYGGVMINPIFKSATQEGLGGLGSVYAESSKKAQANKDVVLANAHWSYIRGLLVAHGVIEEEVDIIGFHYKEAFKHGWKHAKEDGN